MTEMLVYRCQRDPDAPSRARAVLSGLLGGLEPDVARDVKLMVSELVTNAVRTGTETRPWSSTVARSV